MIKTICAFAAGFTFTALLGFDISPSDVDEDGFLREPFALVPLGTASTEVAIGTRTFLLIKRARQ